MDGIQQTIGNMLRTFELEKQEVNINDPCYHLPAATAFDIRIKYHTVLNVMASKIVFGRIMVLCIQFKEAWFAIVRHKKKHIAKDN